MFVVILICNAMLISRTTIENEEALCVNTYILEEIVVGIEEEKCAYVYSDILGSTAAHRLVGTPVVAIPDEKNRRRVSHLTPFLWDLVSPIDT